MKDDDGFVCTKEAARILGVDPQTLANWRSENKKEKKHPDLKHFKVGKKVNYFKKSLFDFIKRNTVGNE
jgi:transposase-like protein